MTPGRGRTRYRPGTSQSGRDLVGVTEGGLEHALQARRFLRVPVSALRVVPPLLPVVVLVEDPRPRLELRSEGLADREITFPGRSIGDPQGPVDGVLVHQADARRHAQCPPPWIDVITVLLRARRAARP